jgi:hypothetical protein
VLVAKGVTAWQRLATHLTGTTGTTGTGPLAAKQTRCPSQTGPTAQETSAQAPASLPQAVTAQLVHALAGLAVALTGT